MQKMTGTGTGTGKVIHRGLAKPDDPVFKEGWTVTLPQSGRRSSTPSSSTPAKTLEQPQELYNGKRFQELPEAEKSRITKEQFLADHPTVTAEEFDEMARAYGF